MIKVSVLYPNRPGARFDLDYYRATHVPLVLERCGDAIKRGEIEWGIAGLGAGSAPPFLVAAHLLFDSAEAMQATFGRHVPEFGADLANFTDIEPVVQVGEVLL
jgi:uncharacterized protein (TIGR02118 family)